MGSRWHRIGRKVFQTERAVEVKPQKQENLGMFTQKGHSSLVGAWCSVHCVTKDEVVTHTGFLLWNLKDRSKGFFFGKGRPWGTTVVV